MILYLLSIAYSSLIVYAIIVIDFYTCDRLFVFVLCANLAVDSIPDIDYSSLFYVQFKLLIVKLVSILTCLLIAYPFSIIYLNVSNIKKSMRFVSLLKFCQLYTVERHPFSQMTIHYGRQRKTKGWWRLAVVKANINDKRLLARLMRAEAEEDGELGMLMVGNVGVNRIRANCLDFLNIRTINDMVFQSPGGFEATQKGYFYQRARDSEVRLAQRVINGERFHPASHALWFFRPTGACPAQWYNQWNAGRFKAHCFYNPSASDCPNVYGN